MTMQEAAVSHVKTPPRHASRVVLVTPSVPAAETREQRASLIATLLDRGYAVSRVCSPDDAARVPAEPAIVLGSAAGDAFDQALQSRTSVKEFLPNLEGRGVTECLEAVDQADAKIAQDRGSAAPAAPWKPWFPVIDFDRCTNCMQCLSFCLFDVYGVTPAGKITVQNESNCKTDCPACSRVCPEVAILFPKYKAGPINGDEVQADDVRREAMKIDISSLLGGDIYSMLRDRSVKAKSRFSKERDDERALKERQRCLQKLQSDLSEMDIPSDVLRSLPSADEIRAKAEKAKQLAQQAIERNAQELPPTTHG